MVYGDIMKMKKTKIIPRLIHLLRWKFKSLGTHGNNPRGFKNNDSVGV